jgi:hypothetical protein
MIHPPTDKHRFYYPEYIESALKEIKLRDFSNHSFDQMKKIVNDYLGSTPVMETTFKTGNFLARARTKKDNVPFNRFSKITIRDKQFVKSYGRAHRPDQSIFYCSTNYPIAIREATQWHKNDIGTLISRYISGDYNPHVICVTVSIWKVIKDLKLASLFLNQDAMSANPVVKHFGNKTINDNINNWDKRVVKSKNLILEFFSNEFAKKEIRSDKDYLLSAYYSNEIYLAAARLDGVTYPTVALEYKGENMAITQDAYKEKLEFVTAYHNYVSNIEINGEPMRIGEIYQVEERKDDILIWKELHTGKILPIDESE